MDIQFYGANCITLTTQGARVVIDDNIAELGGKTVTKPGDIALFTNAHGKLGIDTKLTIDSPGEFEVSSFSIYGIPARAHVEEGQQKQATMYKIIAGGTSIAVVGHIYPELSDDQLERIGMVDLLIIPVGGNGYTLDPTGALSVIKKIEPKMVIPTHYADKDLQYPVPQQDLEQALKGLGMEATQTTQKLKLKSTDSAEAMQLIVLERS